MQDNNKTLIKGGFMNKHICVFVLLSICAFANVTTFVPVEDVYISTFGGGEGLNTFMKFNISSLAAGNTIDSVFLNVFVYYIAANWDGDANFWNVNDQTWTEATSANTLWVRPTSNLTNQASGFGTAMGWDRSVDLKQIFLTDYGASNTFCSIKIKDPDDPTTTPPPGSWPFDRDDTLGVGNRVFNEHIYFYPHEFVNGPPILTVFYTPAGSVGEQIKEDASENFLRASPNPFSTRIDFRYMIPDSRLQDKKFSLRVYDASGKLVRDLSSNLASAILNHGSVVSWDGTDDTGERVSPGVYLICIPGQRIKVIKL